jgi:protein-S-isoprenylcysteine O-methyltransferase Ste14
MYLPASLKRSLDHDALRFVVTAARVPLAVVAVTALVVFAKVEWFWPSLAVATAGELIQVWCFACLSKNRVLAAVGPYALVRNPMYLGRFVLVMGTLLLPGVVWLPPAFAVVYWAYMTSRVGREEPRLKQAFGEEYTRYCAEVRRFLPRLRPYRGNRVACFSWKLFFQNHAHWNLLAVVAIYGAAAAFLFYVRPLWGV